MKELERAAVNLNDLLAGIPGKENEMASIGVTEDDFFALAEAANQAHQARRFNDAKTLDKLARKVNAALAHANPVIAGPRKRGVHSGAPPKLRWQDVPSTINAG